VLGVALSAFLLSPRSEDAEAKRKKKKKKKSGAPPPASPPPSPGSPPPPSPPPSPPPLQPTYQCAVSSNALIQSGGDTRVAQTFTAGSGGLLRRLQVAINKGLGSGDYRLQLVAVDAGAPSNNAQDVLAVATIADDTVPSGDTALIADFAGPALVQDTEYAVVVSRPGASNLAVQVRLGEGRACTGRVFTANGGGAFTPLSDHDAIVSIFVA
jgi:hypothetical protein